MPPELLLLAEICTKSFVGWGFAPDLTGEAYSAPPDRLAGLGGGPPWEKKEGEKEGGEGKEGNGGEGGEGRGKEKGKRRKGKGGENVSLALILQFDQWL